jgi:D-alanyl-D-alanine carboxypeptidase/D-alanyl-D-alanine-endopeptidase (penicillin-binding protein 4)
MKEIKPKTKTLAVLLVPLMLAGCASLGHDPVLAKRLTPILHRHDDSGAVVSARVIELPSGRELFADDPDAPFMPASNLKLVVTAAALDGLGPEYTFKTYLARSGDDLWIVGTGDPAIGDPRIAEAAGDTTETVLEGWVTALAETGCTSIAGDICYDESYFEPRQVHPHWDEEDLVHWYACPVSGLNFNDNCIDVTITPGAEGTPVQYTVMPRNTMTTIVNQCTSGTGEQQAFITKMPDSPTYVLSGVAKEREKLKAKPVDAPGAFFADALRTVLREKGIPVAGTIREIRTKRDENGAPLDCRIIAVHESSMTDVLWRTNKNSQNLFAECLDKALGRHWAAEQGRDEPGSWANGSEAIHVFMREHGIDASRLVVDDGSGLSRGNRVTARLLTDLLAVMYTHPYGEAYRASMARGGIDGTVSERLTDLKGRVFAKTGYIGGVRTLSGYIQTRQGRWLAFSFLYNRIPGPVRPYEEMQDDACRVLADWQPARRVLMAAAN